MEVYKFDKKVVVHLFLFSIILKLLVRIYFMFLYSTLTQY